MPVDRPTFSENWYRVSDLKPELRPTVQVYRQFFRGRPWHVVRDPSNNKFFRLDDAAYHFVALLDGTRTVAEVWDVCNDRLGDRAPTQGEAIHTLGQLYASNLLRGDLPPDAEGMFERFRKRRVREVGSYLTNFLFIRIPLIDPDHILNTFVRAVGWVFAWPGMVIWAVMIGIGFYSLTGRFGELLSGRHNVLAHDNLVLLYIGFAIIKAIHEFGHGFACKKFGVEDGSGGEVHTMGIMLLVFAPVPYCDASSSWAFRSKWKRAFVGAAGVYVELFIAAIAAVVWANTDAGTIHALAYNMMFVAGVSTVLFNLNPLLRFDGYYILSDLLEIPNLHQRSKEYVYYLVKRYVYGVRRPYNPVHTIGESVWMPIFCVASFIYRVIICVGIIFFIANQLFTLGLLMAVSAVVVWVVIPIGKFIRYLATSPELIRTRSRAVLSTAGAVAAVVLFIGAVPFSDHGRAQGVVEPEQIVPVHLEAPARIEQVLPTGTQVSVGGAPIVVADNEDLRAQYEELLIQAEITRARYRGSLGRDPANARIYNQHLNSLNEQLAHIREQLDSLTVLPPFDGVWVSPQANRLNGAYVNPADELGVIASDDQLILRVVTDQWIGPRVIQEFGEDRDLKVELRVRGKPRTKLTGVIREAHPAGLMNLPSRALGYSAGGAMEVAMDDPEGRRAADPFFEFVIIPQPEPGADTLPLKAGQRVAVRFTLQDKPLALQWWLSIRQLIQLRLNI